jgi:alkylhydroperoxidase family enzyme
VQQVYRDWRTAPVDGKLRAMLGFLEAMTLRPDELTAADARAVRAAGVSEAAVIDAVHVGALFNMIVRLADALDFAVPSYESSLARAEGMLRRGYALFTLDDVG